ncbi:putative PPE family protein PPE33 [Mycobacterium avium subsp. hominissuis]|uniref:PPE family protein PPE33 n=1 Tax=Mycobacterium avium subsp. hominissuis TaxID=439334 RepID=A0AAI8SMQ4_MYCAV|nr:putative PPE family protein PPE33 [Mycobacterium avium subsp. hominissuis]
MGRPSAAAMAAAAAPYVAWLAATSAQARTAAEQATAAASAFESAFAAVVPPAEIATNRARLAMLSASNVFGQNSAAIAAAEAEYGQMWAQDAAAMFGYASASAAATRLAPFTEPPKTTNDAGIAAQAAALGEATGRGAGTAAADATAPPSGIISQLLEALGNASRGYMDFWDQVLNTLTGSPLAGTTWQNTFGILADIGRFSTVANDSMSPINLAMTEFKMFYKLPVEGLDIPKSALGAGLGLRSAGAGLTGAVSVGVGEANTVGRLSVPPTWASATPAIRLASGLAPATAAAAAPAAGIPAGLLGQMALGSVTGGALGAVAPQVGSGRGVRVRAAKPAEPVKLDDVIAKLQRQPEAVQHWNVDKAGLDDLLDRLSKKPGIHAVHVSSGGKPTVTLPDAGPAGSA